MADFRRRLGRFFLGAAVLLGLGAGGAPTAAARDVFVLLSGGDSPGNNNYSQYLQARAVSAFFQRQYPAGSVWTFFGAGNVSGEPPRFSDVRHDRLHDGALMEAWTVGALPGNRPARRDTFLAALRGEILPAVAGGGTLFLFVGDHGSLSSGRHPESLISLWGFTPDPAAPHGWRYEEGQSLSVGDLRDVLRAGLGRGKVVFCMTQCHSGGFHFLAVPRELTPNPDWFTDRTTATRAPAAKRTAPLPRIAGFTATDEKSAAAGCDPDPNPEVWAGYERWLPESLLGIDLLSLQPKGRALPSFAAAHHAATLADATIDKPCSTSEQYLERWAGLIEKRLVPNRHLQPAVQHAVAAYERAVNGLLEPAADAAFRDKTNRFHQFHQRLIALTLDPGARDMLRHGTRQDLEKSVAAGDTLEATAGAPAGDNSPEPAAPPNGGRRGGRSGRRAWRNTLRPAWQRAVAAENGSPVPALAREFELHLLKAETNGHDFFFPHNAQDLREEVFWFAGYGHPQSLDARRAAAIAEWAQDRHDRILTWARASTDPAVLRAAQTLAGNDPPATPAAAGLELNAAVPSPSAGSPDPWMPRDIAAERALLYRRVLGAWRFLLAVEERPALEQLRELTELESTPLPSPHKNAP